MAVGKDAGVVAVEGVGEHVRAETLEHLFLSHKVIVFFVGTPEAVVKVEDLGDERKTACDQISHRDCRDQT